MKSYSLKAKEVSKQWLEIDAAGLVLGRLASRIALILRGKHKAVYTPHMDCGDYVVILNSDQIALTGKKYKEKFIYRHSGYPGGIKKSSVKEMFEKSKSPEVVFRSVRLMMPRGPLARKQLSHLKIYRKDKHSHEAQNPIKVDVSLWNNKNKK